MIVQIEIHDSDVKELLEMRKPHSELQRNFSNWEFKSLINEAIREFIEKYGN